MPFKGTCRLERRIELFGAYASGAFTVVGLWQR